MGECTNRTGSVAGLPSVRDCTASQDGDRKVLDQTVSTKFSNESKRCCGHVGQPRLRDQPNTRAERQPVELRGAVQESLQYGAVQARWNPLSKAEREGVWLPSGDRCKTCHYCIYGTAQGHYHKMGNPQAFDGYD